jgi:hypothetical protein
MAEKNRIEGQLWIDRKEPHGLKYHTEGETYQLVPEKVYSVSGGTTGIPKGSLVAVDGSDTFKLAQFPKDIDRIVGICPIDIDPGETEETSILKNGNITLAQNSAIFEHTDVPVTWNNMIGAPVYWFIGRTNRKIVNDTVTYPYIDPGFKNVEGAVDNFDNRGKLTLSTPSGMRWGTGTSCNDNSLNVGYSNLPVVGTVVNVDTTNNEVTINVNISKFESSLEWHWPYYSKYKESSSSSGVPSDEINGDASGTQQCLEIRHGLFPNITDQSNNNYYNFRTRCFCDAVVIEGTSNDTEHKAFVGVENYYGLSEGEPASTEKKTVIEYKSRDITTRRLNVSGKVVYGFVRQYE